MSNKVLSQIDADGNATVVLNRPEVHNAFDPEMVEVLTATLKKLESNDKVRAVVITGAGRNFCAGADIEHMKKSAKFSHAQNLGNARATATMLLTLHGLGKPTIACVRGAARGGGVGLVSACDIAIAERGATFRLSEVRLGIIPAMISPYVIGAIGPRHSHRYMLAHLYSSGPAAIVAVKKLIPEVAGARIDHALMENVSQRIAEVRITPEAQEGLSAFLEKRKSAWSTPASEKAKKENNRQDAKPAKKKSRN